MTISFSTILVRKSVMLGTCVLLSSWPCWAQTPDGNDKSSARTASAVESATAHKAASTPIPGSKTSSRADSFVISADDVLAINVWKEAEISRTVTVRSDGKISLPLVGELQASAKTPKQLEDEIGSKLSGFISEPAVTVIVQEIRSQRFNILGRVGHPGSYQITEAATVLDAIAIAGGVLDFAKQKSMYILRKNPDGTQTRLPFNYKEVVGGKRLEQNIKLEPHDTVVVP
jgi:polysaccharide biosynthesis/export protein